MISACPLCLSFTSLSFTFSPLFRARLLSFSDTRCLSSSLYHFISFFYALLFSLSLLIAINYIHIFFRCTSVCVHENLYKFSVSQHLTVREQSVLEVEKRGISLIHIHYTQGATTYSFVCMSECREHVCVYVYVCQEVKEPVETIEVKSACCTFPAQPTLSAVAVESSISLTHLQETFGNAGAKTHSFFKPLILL